MTLRRAAAALIVLTGAMLLYVFRGHLYLDEIRASIEQLDGPALFAAVTVLPLLGFPVTPLHVMAGVRFGWAAGLILITLSIVLQHVLAWAAVRLAPAFFEARLARVRARIPKAAHPPVTVFTALVPGVPYFATLYVLPLIGVPFAVFVAISAPLHAVRSIVAVVFGDMSDNLTPGRIAYLVIYGIVISGTCAWLFRKLRQQLGSSTRQHKVDEDFTAATDGLEPGHSQSR